jgi:hypothetical protein
VKIWQFKFLNHRLGNCSGYLHLQKAKFSFTANSIYSLYSPLQYIPSIPKYVTQFCMIHPYLWVTYFGTKGSIYLSLWRGVEIQYIFLIPKGLLCWQDGCEIQYIPHFHRTVSPIHRASQKQMQFLTNIVASILSILIMMLQKSSCLFKISLVTTRKKWSFSIAFNPLVVFLSKFRPWQHDIVTNLVPWW